MPLARLEAQRLLAWVLGTDRGGLVARHPERVDSGAAERFYNLLERRAGREPLQYLVGEQEFRGRSFLVDRRVLIPRPETEELVEAVLELPLPPRARVLDWGTGSGCIAISLAAERGGWEVWAADISTEALEVARINAARHGTGQVVWLAEDLEPLRSRLSASLDLLVSNPPYVSQREWEGLAPEVREYEPKLALVPGRSGLEAYRRICPAAIEMLSRGGYLALELGYRSEPAVRAAVAQAGLAGVEVRDDSRGIPRILIARRP